MSKQNNKIEKNCLICNKIFFTFPCIIKRGEGKYCSRKCLNIEQTKKIEKNCIVCNKIFYVSPCRIKIGEGKYCSRKCYISGRIYRLNTIKDFWSNVDIRANINLCWEWKKYKNPNGYGQFHYKRKVVLSNRLSYFLTFPEQNTEENRKLHVLHTCDNPPCCNPYHLKLGTAKDNSDDMIQKNRQPKGEDIKSAKLDAFDVKQILLLKGILKTKTIAEMYNVHTRTLSDIFNNKTWKHIIR